MWLIKSQKKQGIKFMKEYKIVYYMHHRNSFV